MHIYRHTQTNTNTLWTIPVLWDVEKFIPTCLRSGPTYPADAHRALRLKPFVTSNSLHTPRHNHGNSVYWNWLHCYFWAWFSFTLRSINILLTVLKGLDANQQNWWVSCIHIHVKAFFPCSSGAIYQPGHLLKMYIRLRKVLVIKLSAHNSVTL